MLHSSLVYKKKVNLFLVTFFILSPLLVRFRHSEDMVFMQSILPEEAARAFVHEVALLQCVEFEDLNDELSAFQRRYTKHLVQIQEIERRLGALETHLTTREIPFARHVQHDDRPPTEHKEGYLDAVDRSITTCHTDTIDSMRILDELRTSLAAAKEFELVLQETGRLLRARGMPF